MTGAELNVFRRRLEALRTRLGGMVTTLQDEALTTDWQRGERRAVRPARHPADRSSDAFEEDVALSLLVNEGDMLKEVEAALAQLDAGKFGLCTACGAAIPHERLRALPYARYCRHCEETKEAAATAQ